MKKNIPLTSFALISDKGFFLIVFIYQCLLSLQGLDFADQGFFATFYQQIFRDPESVTLNFLHWFTGIIGGSFFYVFPNAGLLGIRVLGVIVVTSTIATVYNLLKRYINHGNLKLGILLLILFISNDIKEMYYDNVSALLSVLSASFLFYGLIKENLLKISLSGVLVSLNMFSRVPSLVMLAFFIAILFYGFLNKTNYKDQFKQIIFFFTGFGIMTIIILVIMSSIGHLSIYIESLKSMLSWGGSEYDNHNVFSLFQLFIKDYLSSFIYSFVLLALLLSLGVAENILFKDKRTNFKILLNLISLLGGVLIIYLTISQRITWLMVLRILTGLSLFVSILILSFEKNKDFKLLVFLGIVILIFAPFGSAGGLFAMGRNCLWLIFPVTIDYLHNTKYITSNFASKNNDREYSFNFSISAYQLSRYKKYLIGSFIFISLYYTYYYPYFDKSDRIKMFFSVDNKFVSGIYTSEERAAVVNELLAEAEKYVRKDDYVLAYDNIPMFHYLTETKPYVRNSWPWLYVPEEFKSELANSITYARKLPVVVLQKMNTLDSDWPTNSLNYYQKSIPDYMRDSIMYEFMKSNNYTKVWENKVFEIRIPKD